jgi:hypothetical protein
VCGIIRRKSSGAIDLADYWVKRAVRMLGRTEISQPVMLLTCNIFQKRCREPRFADTGFAGN